MMVLVVLASAVQGAASASAQVYRAPAPFGWVVGDYWFQPVLEVTNAGGFRVCGIAAIANDGALAGSNLAVVWYERPVNAGAAWQSKTWAGASRLDALKSLGHELSMPPRAIRRWITAPDLAASQGNVVASSDYKKGFAVSDPVGVLVNASPERDDLVAALKEWGFAVADMPFEKSSNAANSVDAFMEQSAVFGEWLMTNEAPGVPDVEFWKGPILTFQRLLTQSMNPFPVDGSGPNSTGDPVWHCHTASEVTTVESVICGPVTVSSGQHSLCTLPNEVGVRYEQICETVYRVDTCELCVDGRGGFRHQCSTSRYSETFEYSCTTCSLTPPPSGPIPSIALPCALVRKAWPRDSDPFVPAGPRDPNPLVQPPFTPPAPRYIPWIPDNIIDPLRRRLPSPFW